jgi:pyruvate dehydrogenase E1 component alpha subunit
MAPGELDAAKQRDPVTLFRKRLLDEGHASESQIAEIEAVIKAEVDEAVEFALNSEYPGIEEIEMDVYGAGVAA